MFSLHEAHCTKQTCEGEIGLIQEKLCTMHNSRENIQYNSHFPSYVPFSVTFALVAFQTVTRLCLSFTFVRV